MKFTVDRNEWFRGRGSVMSRLLTIGGKMCCLGFACIQSGVNKANILDTGSPTWLTAENRIKVSFFFDTCSALKEWVKKAININDDPTISDGEREQKLEELFASDGHEIEFIN